MTTVTSHKTALMEVIAQDRPALLYHAALVMHQCKVKLVSAKVSTVGEKAEDTFLITDRDGNPANSEQQRNYLKQRLQFYLFPTTQQ